MAVLIVDPLLIKYSAISEAPSALQSGELAYSDVSDTLFIGTNSGIVAIGGSALLSSLQSAIANKADEQHTHTTSAIEGLNNLLDGKANQADLSNLAASYAAHTHSISSIQGLSDALLNKADVNHTHNFSVPWDSPGAIGAASPNTGKFTLLTVQNGSVVAIQTAADGGVRFPTRVGFFDRPPQGKPSVTGSRAGNTALSNLLTSLASLGLITNNTGV